MRLGLCWSGSHWLCGGHLPFGNLRPASGIPLFRESHPVRAVV